MGLAWLDAPLLALTRERSAKALASGALVPLAMDLTIAEDGGIPFEIRSAGALAKKDLARALQSGSAAAKPFDPFEPFEPAMFVADVETNEARGDASTHVVLLNKFPALPDHVLLVTRAFVPQLAPLSREDFVALAQLTHAMAGLAFYNGGRLGGASQEHRHFQLVARESALPIERALVRAQGRGPVPGLPFRHAFVRHAFASASSPEHGADLLERAFREASADLGIHPDAPLPPCNLLATRAWLMLVPRTHEHWSPGGVSVNALGFAGLVLVRSEDLIAPLQRFGLLRALDTVTR